MSYKLVGKLTEHNDLITALSISPSGEWQNGLSVEVIELYYYHIATFLTGVS